MPLEELTNQYHNAHKLEQTAQAIETTRRARQYNPWNTQLVEQQAKLLKTKHTQLIVIGNRHVSIDDLITQEPARIHQAFNNIFPQEELQRAQQDYNLLAQQQAQAIIQYLGTTNLQEHNEEEKITPKTRKVLKDLYQTIIHNPESVSYDATSEIHVTALDKAWYFGTRQDKKEEEDARATTPEETRKHIAELRRLLEE